LLFHPPEHRGLGRVAGIIAVIRIWRIVTASVIADISEAALDMRRIRPTHTPIWILQRAPFRPLIAAVEISVEIGSGTELPSGIRRRLGRWRYARRIISGGLRLGWGGIGGGIDWRCGGERRVIRIDGRQRRRRLDLAECARCGLRRDGPGRRKHQQYRDADRGDAARRLYGPGNLHGLPNAPIAAQCRPLSIHDGVAKLTWL